MSIQTASDGAGTEAFGHQFFCVRIYHKAEVFESGRPKQIDIFRPKKNCAEQYLWIPFYRYSGEAQTVFCLAAIGQSEESFRMLLDP